MVWEGSRPNLNLRPQPQPQPWNPNQTPTLGHPTCDHDESCGRSRSHASRSLVVWKGEKLSSGVGLAASQGSERRETLGRHVRYDVRFRDFFRVYEKPPAGPSCGAWGWG